MKYQAQKIGFAPYAQNLKSPGDRRRFVFFANERKLNFEIADPSKRYDILYLTSSSNLSAWVEYKKENPTTKLIFEIIDSYLLAGISVMSSLRGLTKFLTSKEKKIYFNYRNAFTDIIKLADAVVCSTPIQKKHIEQFNTNVHVSLDYFSDEITHLKTNYNIGEKIKLVWEGQAYTVRNLLELNDVFKALAGKIELHIITDPQIKYPFKIFNRQTKEVLKNLACDYQLYNWEKDSFSKIIAGCDLSIIPIDMGDKLMLNKPEHKLLLLWEIGIPVITSATPAYTRVFNHAGLNYSCRTKDEWLEKLKGFIEKTTEQRITDMQKATEYLNATHTKQQLINNWDAIFSSVM